MASLGYFVTHGYFRSSVSGFNGTTGLGTWTDNRSFLPIYWLSVFCRDREERRQQKRPGVAPSGDWSQEKGFFILQMGSPQEEEGPFLKNNNNSLVLGHQTRVSGKNGRVFCREELSDTRMTEKSVLSLNKISNQQNSPSFFFSTNHILINAVNILCVIAPHHHFLSSEYR